MGDPRAVSICDLVERLLDCAPQDRAILLDEACAHDPDLRRAVVQLLDHESKVPQSFLTPPAACSIGLREIALGQEDFTTPLGRAATRSPSEAGGAQVGGCDSAPPTAEPNPLPAQRVGRYVVTRVLASGGMGIVFLAQQEQPRREVALKVMSVGIAVPSMLKRFEYESQVLGHLCHPNIAQVYEAGTYHEPSTGCRQPYFAMEYVQDASAITQYSNQRELGTREKLKLFLQACDAVHYGHQKGIIHRDLKPSNILVDASGAIKIIDFGIARVTNKDVAVTTFPTDSRHIVGTLQYMSPEQCNGAANELDLRTDVYSLGVVLYELLTGQLPYRISNSALHVALNTIRDTAPIPPSFHARILRGDLQTIVLKALEKDCTYRYSSVAALADDIRRYLARQPIAAAPPSRWRNLALYTMRNPWRAASLTLGVLVLLSVAVIGIIVDLAGVARRETELSQTVAYGRLMSEVGTNLLINDVPAALVQLGRTPEEQRESWEYLHIRSRVDQSTARCVNANQSRARQVRSMALDPRSTSALVLAYDPTVGFVQPEVLECSSWHAASRQPFVGEVDSYHAVFAAGGEFLVLTSCVPGAQRSDVLIFRAREPDQGPVARILGCTQQVGALTSHPSLPVLATGEGGGFISIFDLRGLPERVPGDGPMNLEARAQFHGHLGDIISLTFSPDGSLLASAANDARASLWKVDPSGYIAVEAPMMLDRLPATVNAFAFAPDSTLVAGACSDAVIRLWNTRTGELVPDGSLRAHIGPAYVVAFDAFGSRLVSGGADATLRVWEAASASRLADDLSSNPLDTVPWTLTATLRGFESPVSSARFILAGTVLASSLDGTIRTWNPDLPEVPVLAGHRSSVESVAFTRDGRHVLSGSGDGYLILWSAARTTPVARWFGGEQSQVMSVRPLEVRNRDIFVVVTRSHLPGSLVGISTAGDWRGSVSLLEIRQVAGRYAFTLLDQAELTSSSEFVPALAVSTDGQHVAVGCAAGRIRLWTTGTSDRLESAGDLVDEGAAQRNEIMTALAYLSSDGRWLASASGPGPPVVSGEDHAIVLWDTRLRKRLVDRAAKGTHKQDIQAIAFHQETSTKARWLASSSTDGAIHLWGVTGGTGDISPELRLQQECRGHTRPVGALAFHPVQRRLASGGDDNVIRLWDLDTGVEVASLRGHAGPVRAVEFSRDGATLASASAGDRGIGNDARLWETKSNAERPPNWLAERATYRRAYAIARRLDCRGSVVSEAAWSQMISTLAVPDEVRKVLIENRDDLCGPQ